MRMWVFEDGHAFGFICLPGIEYCTHTLSRQFAIWQPLIALSRACAGPAVMELPVPTGFHRTIVSALQRCFIPITTVG